MLSRGLIFTLWAFLTLQGVTAEDTPLSRINIPLTLNKDKRYVVGVNMSSSSVEQKFRFAIAGNTGYVAVAGSGCKGCEGVPTYNALASDSQRPFQGSAGISIGSASIKGPFIKENCSFRTVDNSPWQFLNQTILIANSSSSLFSNLTSGLIGLGTNANGQSGDFFDTIYGGWFARNPSRNNFTFGMDLKPPRFTSDNDVGNGGAIHWVVADSGAHQSTVTWNTAVASVNVPDSSKNANSGLAIPETDWSIHMDGWSASMSGAAVANTSGVQALIEPFFPDVYFPTSQANMFYSAVPSAVRMNSTSSGGQAWNIPCDSTLSVAFTFAGQSFPLDQTQLVEQQGDGSCIGTIKAWPEDSVNGFLLGSSFISSFYLIFVIGRPGSGVSNSIGMALRSTTRSGVHIGVIVGATVGGVALVALLVAGMFFLCRRRRQKKITCHLLRNCEPHKNSLWALLPCNRKQTLHPNNNNEPPSPPLSPSNLRPMQTVIPAPRPLPPATAMSDRMNKPASTVTQISYDPCAVGKQRFPRVPNSPPFCTISPDDPESSIRRPSARVTTRGPVILATKILDYDASHRSWLVNTSSLSVYGTALPDHTSFNVATWNIWEGDRTTEYRYPYILHLLFDSVPHFDVITLQEVTREFFDCLLEHRAVQRDWLLTDLNHQFELSPNSHGTVILIRRSIVRGYTIRPRFHVFQNTRMARGLNFVEIYRNVAPSSDNSSRQLIMRIGTAHFESHPPDVKRRKEQFEVSASILTSRGRDDIRRSSRSVESIPAILTGDCNITSYNELAPLLNSSQRRSPIPTFTDALLKSRPTRLNEDRYKSQPTTIGRTLTNVVDTFGLGGRYSGSSDSSQLEPTQLGYILTHKMRVSSNPSHSGFIGDRPVRDDGLEDGEDGRGYVSDHLGVRVRVKLAN